MKNIFDTSINTPKTVTYQTPPIITLSGLPGSGKTDLACILSSTLEIYLISNDHIRNYLGTNFSFLTVNDLNNLTRIINTLRLLSLLNHHIPFIIDTDISSLRTIKMLEIIAKRFKYQLIKIRLESYHDYININRIKNRPIDHNKVVEGVIGDNTMLRTYFDEEDYFTVKERKNLNIPLNLFDYIIFNNDNNPHHFNSQATNIIEDLKRRLTK